MEKDKKMSVKDFIKQRKTQFKNIKNKQAQTDVITSFIDTQQIQEFQKSFCELKNEEIIFYLFSEDSMKMTPLLKILLCENLEKWLSITFSQIKKSWEVINEKICQQWEQNQLISNDWRNKLTILNRGVVKFILGLPEKDRFNTGDIIVKEFCSNQNFVSELYRKYLVVDFAKQHFPLNIKINENLLQLVSILDSFYITLSEKLWPNEQKILWKKFVDLRNLSMRDNIWNSGDFINAIKTNELNQYSFELKEMHYNFMHKLVSKIDINTIIQAHKLLQTSQNLQYPKLLKKIYASFQSNEETPIDIALKTWTFSQLQPLMKFISQKPQTIKFSTNSLNFVLQNQCLNQFQKQQMIKQILSQKFSKRGYIESVKLDKHVQKKLASSQKPIQMCLTTNNFGSVIIYDTDKLIYKKHKKSYPLLSYLQQFKEKSNLQIVEKLFLKNLLDRKSSKMKIISTIKLHWENEQSFIQENSEEHKQVQELLYYHTPLLYIIAKMKNCQCSQYLLDKIFFNCPQIYFKKIKGSLEVGIGRHFLVIYLENCSILNQNTQNNFILEKIFLSKESQKFIGSKYNFYVELLKALNLSNVFVRSKDQFYMIRQVRFYLKEYFDSLQPQQYFESDYFTELSCWFFSLEMQKKKGKKQQKYFIGKDWGLYDADEICKKLAKINLKKYLKKAIEDNKQDFGKKQNQKSVQKIQDYQTDPTKMTKIQKITKILINYQKGIKDQDEQVQQLPYPDFGDESVFWFKTRYHQYKTYNSLKKYIQKIKYELEKQSPPQNLNKTIEMSLEQKHLQQKINLLIKQSFDFFFSKRQLSMIEKQKMLKQEEKYIYEMLHGQIKQIKRTSIKDQLLNRIVQRMIERKLSFMMALIYCQQGQEIDLDSLLNRKQFQPYRNKVIKFLNKRSKESARLPQDFSFPQHPVQPIPFHTFIQLEKTLTMGQEGNISRLTIKNILINFFMNLKAKIMLFQHPQNNNFKKHQIQKQKRQKTKELIEYWQKWHGYIKERLEYKENIQRLVQQKKKYLMNKHAKKIDKLQKTGNSQQNSLQNYYSILGYNILLKYHKDRLDLSQMLTKLSTQEVFIIDSVLESEKNYNLMLVYKMEAEQKPYDTFMERIKIMELSRRLSGDKSHKNIQKIFMNQLQRMTLQEFSQVIKSIEYSMFVNLWDIFKNIQDERKMIWLLQYILQSQKVQYKKKFTSFYLLGLMREDMPQLTMRILLTVDKKQFKFVINEKVNNKTKRLCTDNIAFYHQCQFQTFLQIKNLIKEYLNKTSKFLEQKVAEQKIKQIIESLTNIQAWDRLQMLLKINDFDNMEMLVRSSFECIGQSLITNKNSLQTQLQTKTFQSIIDKLFELYKQLSIPYEEKMFVNAFLCNPSKAFQFMKPLQLTILGYVICLKIYPQEVKTFLTHQVKVNTSKKPDPGYFKQNFPLTPYYYQKFGNNEWMLDLLRVERNILKAFNQLHRLDKTMESLILLDKMDDNFEQFYTQQEIELKCLKLLSSNTITSIKKYPSKWFQKYFQNNDIKNLSIMTKQLLVELIDLGYVKKEHIFKVISTCKLDIVKYFFSKYQIQLNFQTVQKLQKDILDSKYKNSIWQFLSNIQNQHFVIEFIKNYNLLEVCPTESYEDILFTNIAIYKRITLLKFLLEYFQQKADRQLQFVFNKKGKILHYLITFPQEISVTMNFYEYFFLVKQSQNQCPQFYISSRFLINNDNYEKQLQKYNFIPEMKRRLQILNILCNIPNVNKDMNWKSYILLKNIFTLHQHPQNKNPLLTEIKSQKRWTNFISYLVDQNLKLFYQQDVGTLCQTLILYLSVSKTGIPVQQIGKIYPKEIEVIKKVDKFIKKDVNVSELALNIIKNNPQLKAILLKDNFQLFMQNFENQLQLMSTFDEALLYLKGVLSNLTSFENQEKYRKYLEIFLDLCFSSDQDSYLQSYNYSLYLKKSILSLMLVSYCEGNGFTFKKLSQILCIKEQQPGHIFYMAAKKANQVSVRRKLEPFFDIRSWNSIIEQISHIKLSFNQNEKVLNLEKLIQDSLQKLENDLDKNFKIKIENLRDIVKESTKKVKENSNSNIFELITILINETYILSNCYELHRQMIDIIKEQKSLELQKNSQSLNSTQIKLQSAYKVIFICFDPQKFNLNISPQNGNKIQFTLPFSWGKAQSNIPLMHFDVINILNRAQKHILLYKLTLNPKIDVLNNIYQNLTETSFQNMKFIFDIESLKKLKKGESLKKIVEYLHMAQSGISQIEKTLSQIDQKVFNDRSIPYYSFSDVYGPVKLSQEQNHKKLIDCLSFYELLQLPSKEVIVEVIEVRPSENQINERCLQDFLEYVRYILNEVKDTHPVDMIKSYKFSSKIQLYIDEQTLEIFTYTHLFSLANILKCFSLVSASSDERRRVFENKIDVRYDVLSLIKIYQYLIETLKKQNEKQKSSQIFTFFSSFLRNQNTTKLVDKILLLIIEDAINIMKVLKGALVSFSINKNKSENEQNIKYWLNQNTSVNQISYEIQNQILKITIDVDINTEKYRPQKFIGIQESQLVSRSNFLQSIFSSSEFLTGYFLQKGVLDTQCIKTSRSLSQKLNTTLNVHINYKSLYNYIDTIKKQVSIKQIDNYLYTLRMHILVNLESKLLQHFTSPQIHQSHQALLINTFQVLNNLVLLKNHQSLNSQNLQKTVDELQSSKILSFKCSDKAQQTPLEYIEGYGQQVENFNDLGKNVFLIQVFKNYFTTLVNEGMTFVIGFKESGKLPMLIKFVKRQDIDSINVNQVSYILLVSQSIPSNDELDHKKIIRIFVTDMYKNVYKIADIVKDYLLNLQGDDEQLRNINNLIPVISRNIGIDFDNENGLIGPDNKLLPKRGLKIFEIKLSKQPKFKILPTRQEPLQLCNYLRKHLQLNKKINNFMDKMRIQWKSKDLELLIDSNKMISTGQNRIISAVLNYEKIAQILKNYVLDLQQALSLYQENALRNAQLDCYLSIKYGDKVNIKDNYSLIERKQLFLMYFKQIKFLLTDTKEPKIIIQNNQIIFQLSTFTQQYLKSKQILHQILEVILNRKIQQSNYTITLNKQEREELSIIQLIKCIDIVNIMKFNSQEIQKAYNIFTIINNKPIQIQKPINIIYNLSKTKKSYLKFNSNQQFTQVNVNFNISNPQCQFFTASQVLTIMFNDSIENNQSQTFNTHYDPQTQTIKLYGIIKNQYILVIVNDNQSPKISTVKVNTMNNTTGFISIKQIINFSQLNNIKKYFLIDLQNKQTHQNYIYTIDSKKDQKVINQQNNNTIPINQTITIYVKQPKQNSIINLQKLPITISLQKPNDKNQHNYQNIMNQKYLKYTQIQIISKQIAKISFKFDKAYNVSINLNGFKNILDSKNKDTYQIIVTSNQQAVIENTKFVQVHFRNKIHQPKDIKLNDKKTQYKNTFLEPSQKQTIMQDKKQTIQQINKKTNDIQSLVYVVNNQSKNYLTRAGQKRIDYIQVCDTDFNPLQYKGEINIYFKHINNLCKIVPEIERKGLKIGLAWTPTIRGHYKVYFNGVCLNPDYEIGVCAAVADPQFSTVQKPKVTKICFFQETQCTFNLKDSFKNIYTELQQNILGDGLIIDIQTDKQDINKFIKKKQEPINKYGLKRVRFSIDISAIAEPIKTIFSVSLNKQKISQFQILIEGQSLPQRRKNLQKQLDMLNKGYSKDITVSRSNFLEDLFKIAEKSLFTNFSVKFAGQMGIDAGGLKRQFYDMIGNQIKSQQNPFFKPTDSKKIFYFINPEILKNKKKQAYMELFGKYLANSILNGYLIGVNFSPVFVKLLYKDPIQFQDLLQVLPQDESRMYKYLTSAPEEDFEDLQIYFTVIVDKKKGLEIQLKEDGANIQVNHENVKEYLNLLAKVLIKNRYESIMEAFKKGFESVISLNLLTKWIRPHQLWCLTQGTKEINAQMVLNYISFSGSADQSIISWFRRYINESSKQVLEGFLKFASGSSSIDFDQTSKIMVTFQNTGGNTKKLPISHTCWKEIIVPKYKTYEIMNKLLNAAFIFCSQGFGFG